MTSHTVHSIAMCDGSHRHQILLQPLRIQTARTLGEQGSVHSISRIPRGSLSPARVHRLLPRHLDALRHPHPHHQTAISHLCLFRGQSQRGMSLSLYGAIIRPSHSIHQVIKYRAATKNMKSRFPDATPAELAAAETCIVCRSEMREGKKLPCGHILHFGCLRSWLERRHSCPTCMAPVLVEDMPANANNNRADAAQARRNVNHDDHDHRVEREAVGAQRDVPRRRLFSFRRDNNQTQDR